MLAVPHQLIWIHITQAGGDSTEVAPCPTQGQERYFVYYHSFKLKLWGIHVRVAPAGVMDHHCISYTTKIPSDTEKPISRMRKITESTMKDAAFIKSITQELETW